MYETSNLLAAALWTTIPEFLPRPTRRWITKASRAANAFGTRGDGVVVFDVFSQQSRLVAGQTKGGYSACIGKKNKGLRVPVA